MSDSAAIKPVARFRPIRFIALSLAAVLALLVLLSAWVVFVDHDYLRDDAEIFLSELLDRDVSIEGPLRLDVGKMTIVSIDGLRIRGVEGNARANFLEVGHFAVTVETFSLLADTIVVESIELDGLRLNLQQGETGPANWEFDAFASDDSPREPLARLPVFVRDMDLSDLVVEIRSPDLVNTLILNLYNVTETVDDDEIAKLELVGDLNQTPFSINTSIDDMAGLTEFDDIRIDLDAVLGEIRLSGKIEFEDLKSPSRPVADIQLRGADVEYLTDILRLERFAHGPLDVEVAVEPSGDRMNYAIRGAIGEFTVDVAGHFDDLQNLQDVSLLASASGPNAATLLGKFGFDGLPAEAFAVQANLEKTGSTLILNESRASIGEAKVNAVARFDKFPLLVGGTAIVNASGPDIAKFSDYTGLDKSVRSAFSTTLDLASAADGVTRVRVQAQALGATVDANGELTDHPQLTGSEFDVSLRTGDIAKLAALADIELPADLNTTLDVHLQRGDGQTRLSEGRLVFEKDTIQFSGNVGDEPLARDTSIDFELAIAKLRDSLRRFGLTQEDVRNLPLTVAGRIAIEANQASVSALRASYGGATLTVDGQVNNLSASPDANLKAVIAGDDLAAVLPGLDEPDAPRAAFRFATTLKLSSQSIALQDLDVSFPRLKAKGKVAFARDKPLEMIDVSLDASSQDVFGFASVFAKVPSTPNVAMRMRVDASVASGEIQIDRFDSSIGDARLSAKGRIGSPPEFDRSNLNAEINVPNLELLGDLFGVALPAERFSTSFHVENEGSALLVEDFSAEMGKGVIAGNFYLKPGDVPIIRARMTSDYLDLRPYLGVDDEDEAAANTKASLIPDTRVPFNLVKDKEVDVRLEFRTIEFRRSMVRDVALALTIKDDKLDLSEFRMADSQGGTLSGRLGAEASDVGGIIWFRLAGDGIEIGLPAENADARQQLPRYDVTAAAVSSGETVKELAGTANGYLKVVIGDGRINTGLLGIFSQDFLSELLNTLNPFLKTNPYTEVRCAAVLATVENGMLLGNPIFVLQSDTLKMLADAKINLKTEKLDADFNTVAQKGLGISLGDVINPYVRVTGTLASPRLTFDQKAALFEGGAAVATAGISILALNFKNRFLSDKDPCGKAIESASVLFADIETKYGNEEKAKEVLEAGRR